MKNTYRAFEAAPKILAGIVNVNSPTVNEEIHARVRDSGWGHWGPRSLEERAYYIWLENGGGHGDHELHWLQAERELMEATKRGGKPQSDARLKKKTPKPH